MFLLERESWGKISTLSILKLGTGVQNTYKMVHLSQMVHHKEMINNVLS